MGTAKGVKARSLDSSPRSPPGPSATSCVASAC